MLVIEIANEHEVPFNATRLKKAVRAILKDAAIGDGEISIAVVSDAEMHLLNRKYLEHDYPTDVLSFVLEERAGYLEGEVIVSSEYAAQEAERFGWSMDDELLLYVIHGTLHLVGEDDLTPDAKQQMRQREQHYLAKFDLTPRYAADE